MKMYIPPPGEKPSRRSVLKRGLIGGAVLALGGGWLATRRSADVPLPAEPLQVLSAREYAVVYVLVQRFHPSRQGFPDAMALDVARVCDGILAKADVTAQKELKQLLGLFENALPGFLFGLRTAPFTRLSPQEQDVVLTEWAASRVAIRRTGYLALRTLVMAGYWSQKQAWAASGYAGPPPANDPNAPVWKGGGEPRPMGNGVWVEPPPAEPAPPAPAPEGAP